MQMFNTVISSFAALGLMTSVAMAATSGPDTAHAGSVAACMAANEYQPVELLTAVDDGRGNSLVWLEAIDGNWWMCNADGGAIYAYEIVGYDLLDGQGPELIGHTEASYEPGMPRPNPIRIAERVCLEVLEDPSAQVVSSREDGLGDYSVFVQAPNGELALCNASGDGAVFAFAPIGEPLDLTPIS